MSYKCVISGKSRQSGHRVSHANNKTKHAFKANLQSKKIFVPSLGRSVRMRISTEMIRTIDKIGVDTVLKNYNIDPASL